MGGLSWLLAYSLSTQLIALIIKYDYNITNMANHIFVIEYMKICIVVLSICSNIQHANIYSKV